MLRLVSSLGAKSVAHRSLFLYLSQKENDKMVEQCLFSMPTILIAPLALVWLVNHPDYQLPKQGHVVLYGTHDRASTEASKENGNGGSDIETVKNPTIPLVRSLHHRVLIGRTIFFQINR